MQPFSETEVSRVLVPEGEGEHLPVRAYLDEDVARWESERIWTNGWVCVTSEGHLARRGDHLARAVGTEPVVISRHASGAVQAFHNVCQHRGCQLVEEGSHSRPRMVCPYHAWIYGHDGTLQRAPHTDALERHDAGRFDLVPIRTEVLAGLVFVDLSGAAGPLIDELGPLAAILTDYGLADLRIAARIVEDVAANWKVVAENSLECNHCPVVHPEMEGLTGYLTADESVGDGPTFTSRMLLDEGTATLSRDGTTNGRPLLPGLDAEQRRSATFVTHFPGFLASLKPDAVTLFWYWPDGAGRTHTVQEFLFAAKVLEQKMDVDDVVDFTARIARQDWEVCEKVQRGLSSPGYRGGIFSDIEARAHVFDKFIATAYLTGERPLRHGHRIRGRDEKDELPVRGGRLRADRRRGGRNRHEADPMVQ